MPADTDLGVANRPFCHIAIFTAPTWHISPKVAHEKSILLCAAGQAAIGFSSPWG
jgi:hypothetical protein